MRFVSPSSSEGKPNRATSSSSGTAIDGGWRAWWREQATVDGTDWPGLHRGLVEAWRLIRTRAEPFITGLSSHEAGAAP
jgi:hypothetical protein